jgi:hypothetical protein
MKRSLLLLATLAGCASGAAVRGSKDLPVKSVVLYRSGVGYFERAGRFRGESLEFSVKQREVGDFLSSLTAVEQGAGGVRSVSFEVPKRPERPEVCEGEDCEDPADEAARHGEQRVGVHMLLEGDKAHDLSVAYVVGSPIWRPSYRVVFDKGEQALLQAWAVVQNTSGEDWNDVRLSLTTGAPISFRSDLGTPITPERPLVTDSGEVVTSVPLGETALRQQADQEQAAAEPPAAAPAPEASMAADASAEAEEHDEDRKQAASGRAGKRHSAQGQAAAPQRAKMHAAQLEQAVAAQASAQPLSGAVTRYDLDRPVTIPDGGSTMVAIISKRVAGERAHLFAPDVGVSLSHQHPFSVARLENGTGAVLEKGPVSVLADGAFLGQGVLDTLPKDAHAFVPFALDKSIVVEASENYSQEQGALVRVQRGVVTLQRFSQRKTRYRVRNGSDEVSKVYVRHARWGEAELVAPPAGSELLPQKALLPVAVPAKAERELEVVERTPVQVDFGFTDPAAADAITLWLSGPAVEAAQGAALKQALSLRSDLVKLDERLVALEREQAELQNAANEARRNLRAIEKVRTADDLRKRLVERLRQLDARLAELMKDLVETRTKKSELEVRLNEALENVSLIVK